MCPDAPSVCHLCASSGGLLRLQGLCLLPVPPLDLFAADLALPGAVPAHDRVLWRELVTVRAVRLAGVLVASGPRPADARPDLALPPLVGGLTAGDAPAPDAAVR